MKQVSENGMKYRDSKGGFFALISLIIRNERPNLRTMTCQGEIAKTNSSLGESLVRFCLRDGPVWVALRVCAAAPAHS